MLLVKENLVELIDSIRPNKKFGLPSAWCTEKRVMASAYTKRPGPWDWRWSPYFKEPLDNFSPSSPIQMTAIQKSVQIGATQAVLEPIIGFYIDKFARSMAYCSADAEMSRANIDTRITSMIDSAQIGHKIKPVTYNSKSRKTGDTQNRKEFDGGVLYAIGAQNPNKSRQWNAPILMGDEVDGWPIMTRQG